jgi:hypothetical protein
MGGGASVGCGVGEGVALGLGEGVGGLGDGVIRWVAGGEGGGVCGRPAAPAPPSVLPPLSPKSAAWAVPGGYGAIWPDPASAADSALRTKNSNAAALGRIAVLFLWPKCSLLDSLVLADALALALVFALAISFAAPVCSFMAPA